MNKKALKSALSFILIFYIFLGGIHIMLLEYLLPEIYKQIQVSYIYLFLGTLSFLGIFLLHLVSKNDETLIGKGFLAFTVIKILGSLVFLSPWLLDQDEFTRPFVYQFFGVFFPTLLVETLTILKLVNAKSDEIQKND
ncbi:MAG: hypothetical protein ACWA41_02230 [Putridiphycobacter sp.]